MRLPRSESSFAGLHAHNRERLTFCDRVGIFWRRCLDCDLVDSATPAKGQRRPHTGQLAAATLLGAASIKAYEARDPSSFGAALARILDGLNADVFTRDEIMKEAGYVPDGLSPSFRLADEWFSLEEACAEIAHAPIPVCVTTEFMEVVGANAMVQRLWEVDLARELHGPFERSLLAMLSTPRVGDHLLNWEEAISVGISIVKAHHGRAGHSGRQQPYFVGRPAALSSGDPAYVQRFLKLWAAVAVGRSRDASTIR